MLTQIVGFVASTLLGVLLAALITSLYYGAKTAIKLNPMLRRLRDRHRRYWREQAIKHQYHKAQIENANRYDAYRRKRQSSQSGSTKPSSSSKA